jgi:hypothetical protein
MVVFPHVATHFGDTAYSDRDAMLICSAYYGVVRLTLEALEPLVNLEGVNDGLTIEFADHMTLELKDAGAIGLAYRDRNVSFVPTNLSIFEMTARSSTIAMEYFHSLTVRLTNDWKMFNDLAHFLYNEGYLLTRSWSDPKYLKWFGSATLTVVIPDVAHGWQHRHEIMDGIRSGKYPEGRHEYWSDPAHSGSIPRAVKADEHELDGIRHWLSHGAVYGQKVEHH